MSHLIPEYMHDVVVYIFYNPDGTDADWAPKSCFNPKDYETLAVDIEEYEPAYWARLSAPGYLDATEWEGPFDTLEIAKAHMRDLYDIDPDTGESLIDEE